MKKIIHVGILSVGLMLSNAVLADDFADMRNNPNNMTAEQAQQVEAGSKIKLFRKWYNEYKEKYDDSKYVKKTVQGAGKVYGVYEVGSAGYEGYKLGVEYFNTNRNNGQ